MVNNNIILYYIIMSKTKKQIKAEEKEKKMQKLYVATIPTIEVPEKMVSIVDGKTKIINTLTKSGNLKKVKKKSVIKLEPSTDFNIKTGKKYHEAETNIFKENPNLQIIQNLIEILEDNFLNEKDAQERKKIIMEIRKMKKIKEEMLNKIEGGNIIDNIYDYGKAIVYGRNDYSPKVRNLLTSTQNINIKSIVIKRSPVPSVISGTLSIISPTFKNRLREFDELFHLYIEITLQNNKRYLLEKNEVINMEINPRDRPNTESKEVYNIPYTTINQLLENTKKYMTDKKFYGYSARDNNCQDFIVAIFKSNNIGDNSDIEFIKQDTKKLFDNLPILRKFSNTITDIAASADVLIHGKGIQNNSKLQELINEKNKLIQDIIKLLQ